MLNRIDISNAQPVDYDAIDAAAQAARARAEHAAYLARKEQFDALPKFYRDSFAPAGVDEPRGPTGYAWMTERGE